MSEQQGVFGGTEIRQALRLRLSNKHAKEADTVFANTVFIEELGICCGQGRIDLAVVNSLFHGYEIKSDRDSLRRLDNQVELYSKVLDRATYWWATGTPPQGWHSCPFGGVSFLFSRALIHHDLGSCGVPGKTRE